MAFTTIRLNQPNKYRVGDVHEISLKGNVIGAGVIQEIKTFWLKDLNEYIARLDTGYSKEMCEEVIRKMYPRVDFDTTKLMLILIVKK